MKEDKEVLRVKRKTKRETVRNRIVVSSFSWPDSWKARVGRGVLEDVLEHKSWKTRRVTRRVTRRAQTP